MNKELPKGVVIGVIVVAGVVVLGLIGSMFINRGPGNMSSEDVQRAQMEAEVGNQRMQGYIPQGTPGAPPGMGSEPAEKLARERSAGGSGN